MVLCVAAAPIVCGQSSATKPPTNSPLSTPSIIFPKVELTSAPSLYGMNRTEAGRVLESRHLRAVFSGVENGVVVAQKPLGGMLPYGSEVAVILGVPRLTLTGPPAPAYAKDDLTFTARIDPFPAEVQTTYYFYWGDGSPNLTTKEHEVLHQFAAAGKYVVAVTAVINDRVKLASRVVVEVEPPLPPVQPSDTGATVTTVTLPTSTTQPANTTPAQTNPVKLPVNPNQNALLLIGVVVILLLLTITGLLVHLLRKMNRTPSGASPLSINGGPGSIEVEIEHPEQIRQMPAVQVRGGIRADLGGDDA